MSSQDRLENVLRDIHVMISKSETYDADRIIVSKQDIFNLIDRLNISIYEIMDEYELTQQSRDRALRERKREGDKIIWDASRQAEDIYAASVMYTEEALNHLHVIVEEADATVGKLYKEFQDSIRQQEDTIRENHLELKSQLQLLADTEKYLRLIEERNREIEREKADKKGRKTLGKFGEKHKVIKPEIRINEEYFRKAGIPLESDKDEDKDEDHDEDEGYAVPLADEGVIESTLKKAEEGVGGAARKKAGEGAGGAARKKAGEGAEGAARKKAGEGAEGAAQKKAEESVGGSAVKAAKEGAGGSVVNEPGEDAGGSVRNVPVEDAGGSARNVSGEDVGESAKKASGGGVDESALEKSGKDAGKSVGNMSGDGVDESALEKPGEEPGQTETEESNKEAGSSQSREGQPGEPGSQAEAKTERLQNAVEESEMLKLDAEYFKWKNGEQEENTQQPPNRKYSLLDRLMGKKR